MGAYLQLSGLGDVLCGGDFGFGLMARLASG